MQIGCAGHQRLSNENDILASITSSHFLSFSFSFFLIWYIFLFQLIDSTTTYVCCDLLLFYLVIKSGKSLSRKKKRKKANQKAWGSNLWHLFLNPIRFSSPLFNKDIFLDLFLQRGRRKSTIDLLLAIAIMGASLKYECNPKISHSRR